LWPLTMGYSMERPQTGDGEMAAGGVRVWTAVVDLYGRFLFQRKHPPPLQNKEEKS